MAIPIIHKIISKDGGAIYMPKWFRGQEGWGNLAHPDVYAAGTPQEWPCGTIYREGDRTFIYTKMGSSADSGYRHCGYLLRTKAAYVSTTDGMQSAAADSTTVVVNTGGAHSVDVYSGGTLGVFGAAYGSRFIVSSDAASTATATDYDMTLEVDVGFPSAAATTDEITLVPNRYVEVNAYVTDEYSPYVGAIMHDLVAASEYSWVQTGGVNGLLFYWGGPTGDAASGRKFFALHGACQALEAYGTNTMWGYAGDGLQEIGIQAGYCTADMVGNAVWLNILN